MKQTTTTDTIKEKIIKIFEDAYDKRKVISDPEQQVIDNLISLISKTREETIEEIDPFDLVQDCNPDCTSEEHAYHQGTWDSYLKLEKILASLKEKQIKV